MREAAFDAGDSSLGSSGGESSWLIFHRAHEPRRRLAQAQRLGAADYFEVDLRRGERAELRHDALLWGLPFLSERHGLPRPRLRRLWLAQLTAECRLPGRVYFDFKTNDLPLVEEVVEEARREGLAEGAIASSQHWEVLDRLVKVGPERYPPSTRSRVVEGPRSGWGAIYSGRRPGRAGPGRRCRGDWLRLTPWPRSGRRACAL